MSVLTSENGRNVMAEAYDFRTVHGGDVFDIGPFHITTFEMTHIGVNAVGYRIEAGERCSPTRGTRAVRRGDRDGDRRGPVRGRGHLPGRLEPAFFHMSATQAAQHAKAAGAKRLMLTHILPTLDREVSRDEAAAAFEGRGRLAEDGTTIDIAP